MLENVYQPPTAGGPPPSGPQSFGTYNLDRTLTLAWDAYRKNIGIGVGFTLLLALISVAAVFTCFGILFALPHLTASIPIFGLMMIRGRAEINDMFRPFKAYGSLLGAFLLIYIAAQLASFVFSLPYYYLMLHGIDWTQLLTLPANERFQAISNAVQASQANTALIPVRFLSFLALPVSLYISGRVMLVYPLVVERGMGAIDSIKASLEVTAPYQWHLMLVGLIGAVAGSIGLLGCCIGIIVTIPFHYAIQGAAIYQLLGEDTANPATPPLQAGDAPSY